GRADVLLGDADGVLGHVVDRPVEEMIVGEHHQDIRPGRREPTAHLGGRPERHLLVPARRPWEPPGGAGRTAGSWYSRVPRVTAPVRLAECVMAMAAPTRAITGVAPAALAGPSP